MSDYLERARAALRHLLRAGSVTGAAGSPEPPAPNGGQRGQAGEPVSFVDATRAATQPASWIDLFDAAVARNLPVSRDSLALIKRQATRYPPEVFFPTDRERRRF